MTNFGGGQDGEQCGWYPMGALRVSSLRVAAVARRPWCAGDDDDADEAEEQEAGRGHRELADEEAHQQQ